MVTIRVQILAFFIFYINTRVGAFFDLSRKLPPKGVLQVQLDYNLALKSGQGTAIQTLTNAQDTRDIVYTSYLMFKNDVSVIEDGQIFKIAKDAYKEIQAEYTQYKFSSRQAKPTVMSIIAVGQYILLASNQKGQSSFTLSLPESPVAKSLQMCQMVFASERDPPPPDSACTGPTSTCRHANGYNCGEIMAAHLWYRLHPDSTTMRGLGGRILSVSLQETGGVVDILPKDPCGTGSQDTWGCNRFAPDQGLTVIPKSGLAPMQYDLKTLAGGVIKQGQVQLCS